MNENGHWYQLDGTPMHFVPKKNGDGNRPTTLKDARERNLLPSVTSILRILDKPALREWMVRQAVYAVVTSPDVEGEGLDAKITRVLEQEKQQDQESQKARDRGTEIHAAMEALFQGRAIEKDIHPWVWPAYEAVCQYGQLVATEAVLVGDGYAGRTDLVQECPSCWWIWDFKSAKKLPKDKAWPEHRLQAGAYAAAWQLKVRTVPDNRPIKTGNVYISTLEQGAFLICEHDSWKDAWALGFAPLVQHWQWANNYRPEQ